MREQFGRLWNKSNGKAIPIPLADNVFKVENDQSVQRTERVAILVFHPTSAAYVVRGRVQYRDVEGTAYLEMWNVMPDPEPLQGFIAYIVYNGRHVATFCRR